MKKYKSAESWLYDKYIELIFVILFFLPSVAIFVKEYVIELFYLIGMIDCLSILVLLISIKTNYIIGLSDGIINKFKYKWLHEFFI